MADQRLAAPVLPDEREKAMLDLVPLARPRREVAYRDLQPRLIRQPLEFHLPEAHARAIAPAAIGGDQQSLGSGIVRLTHRVPPAADPRYREGRRVMIRPHVDPTRVASHVIDPVGRVATEFRDDEVIDPHRYR